LGLFKNRLLRELLGPKREKGENSLMGSSVMCGIGVEKTRNAGRILVKTLKGIVKFEDLSTDALLIRWFLDN
jgi:hypothetical protein